MFILVLTKKLQLNYKSIKQERVKCNKIPFINPKVNSFSMLTVFNSVFTNLSKIFIDKKTNKTNVWIKITIIH
jgi:hypothetical protein